MERQSIMAESCGGMELFTWWQLEGEKKGGKEERREGQEQDLTPKTGSQGTLSSN